MDAQRCRWAFTLNNYQQDTNFKEHMSKNEFNVARAVWGYEVGTTGIPHLQGYIELKRSYRMSFLKKIFASAHWFVPNGTPKDNYLYCTKSGRYGTIGDFSKEMGVQVPEAYRALGPALIVRALLNPKSALQVKLSREYSEKPHYYDKMATFRTNQKFQEMERFKTPTLAIRVSETD